MTHGISSSQARQAGHGSTEVNPGYRVVWKEGIDL